MPCSCLFHLMRQSQALIDSIYLALTLICQDAARQTASGPMESVSQLQNVFHFFLCRNKGVQTCIHSSSKRSPILSCLHVSFTRLSVKSARLYCSKGANVDTSFQKWFKVFSLLNAFFKVSTCRSLANFMHTFQLEVVLSVLAKRSKLHEPMITSEIIAFYFIH